MNKSFFLTLFAIASVASVSPISFDSSNVKDLLAHVDEQTLVIFDIDGVLMVPKQILGSDPWAYYEGDKFIAKCGDVPAGLRAFLPTWIYVQKHIEVKLVDEALLTVLKTLKERGIQAIGFTARGVELVDRTIEQLDSLGIKLKSNFEQAGELVTEEFCYKNEILFTAAGSNKGGVLKKFFSLKGKRPKKIVFLDDRSKNIASMEKMCEAENIPFVGIRYGGADDVVEKFNGANGWLIGDVQLRFLKRFGLILSDEKADEELKFFSKILDEGGDLERDFQIES